MGSPQVNEREFRTRSRWVRVARNPLWVLLGLSILALALRVTPPALSNVYVDGGEIRFFGVDPYYHLRHAQFAAQNFPSIQRWDVGTNYPTGQRSDAAGLFDLAIGGTAWLIGLGNPTDTIVEHVCAWVPPLLASISVLLLHLLARTVMNQPGALAVCAVYVLHPGPSLQRTMLGFADHHCAEIVLILAAAWTLVRGFGRASSDLSIRSFLPPAFLHALPQALLLFTWAGAPIFLLITAVAFWVIALVEILRQSAAYSAVYAVRYGIGLLLVVEAVGYLWPDSVMKPYLQGPILFGCTVVGMGPLLCHSIARIMSYARVDRRLIVGVLLSLPPASAWYATANLPRAELLLSTVLHKSSAVVEHQAVTPESLFAGHGVPGVLALFCIPVVLARACWSTDYRLLLSAFVPGVCIAGLWVLASDFEYLPPPFIALFTVFILIDLQKLLPRDWYSGPIKSRVPVLVAAVVIATPVWPLGLVSKPWVTDQLARSHLLINDGWSQAMTWLRTQTPAPTIDIDTPVESWKGRGGFQYPAGTYGVFSPWDYGNMIAAIGRRVPVWSRYPTQPAAQWMLSENERRSLFLLCPGCRGLEAVRYVVLDARAVSQYFLANAAFLGESLGRYDSQESDDFKVSLGSSSFRVPHKTYGPRYQRSVAARLYLHDGWDVGRFRLVYASSHESYSAYTLNAGTGAFWRAAYPIDSTEARRAFSPRTVESSVTWDDGFFEYDGVIKPTVKIFEKVKGARVIGVVKPGFVVDAMIELRCGNEGRRVPYGRVTTATPDGAFELVVPHPTGVAPPHSTCEGGDHYFLSVRPEEGAYPISTHAVVVEEADIRGGQTIDIGRL